MSFNQKLNEAFLKAINDKNTQMAREIRLRQRELNTFKKQAITVKKLGSAQNQLNSAHIRAFAIVNKSGKVISGLTGRFSLLNQSMTGLIRESGRGFITFLKEFRTGFRKFVKIPKDAMKLAFKRTPLTKAGIPKRFDLRTKEGKKDLLAQGLAQEGIPAGARAAIAAQRKLKSILPGGIGPVRPTFAQRLRPQRPLKSLSAGLVDLPTTRQVRGRFKKAVLGRSPPSSAPSQFMGQAPPPMPMRHPRMVTKAAKSFGKNVGRPLLELSKNAMGTIGPMMAFSFLLKAFSAIGATFSPVTDLVFTFLELVGTGFQPLVTSLIQAMTRPEVMALLMNFTENINRISTSLEPLMPIMVDLIIFGLVPLQAGVELLADGMEYITPLINDFSTALTTSYKPIQDWINLIYGIPGDEPIVGDLPGIDVIEIPEGGAPDFPGLTFIEIPEEGVPDIPIHMPNIFEDIGDWWGGIWGLAGGGIINPPGGLFNIAEGGKKEVVTDIDQLVSIIQEAFAGNSMSGGGGQNITIIMNGLHYSNEREMAIAVGRELRLI